MNAATTVPQRPASSGTPHQASLPHRARRWLGTNALRIYAVLAFAYIFLPIAYVIVFSFNDSTKSNIVWKGFTLANWADPCGGASGVCPTVGNSLGIGAISTLIATVIGTMMAFALTRYRFRGRTPINLLIFLPMATPEVVLAASLMTLFLNLQQPRGYLTTVVAHVMFSISFVVVAVKARVASLDPRLEQAAMDLYANELVTFWKVTFPMVAPGIGGAALLAFSLSFDDYIITSFNSGDVNTFPKYVYVAAQRGIPAQAYVIGSAMFLIALLIVVVGELLRRRREVR